MLIFFLFNYRNAIHLKRKKKRLNIKLNSEFCPNSRSFEQELVKLLDNE